MSALRRFFLARPTAVEELRHPIFAARGLRLFVKREDQLHPFVSGNKWRKLKHNLIAAEESGAKRLVTFGGAYSNHLVAVACAARALGFASLGILRGEEPRENRPLSLCREFGMELVPVTRARYRDKQELVEELGLRTGENYILPEGGSNELAARGCAEIAEELGEAFDHIATPVGTGGTLAGLAQGAGRFWPGTRVEGICVLKGGGFLAAEVARLAPGLANWKLHLDHHEGGYAKPSAALGRFIQDFTAKTGLPLEPVYSGRMMKGLAALAESDYFRPGAKILCLHTGGILPAG